MIKKKKTARGKKKNEFSFYFGSLAIYDRNRRRRCIDVSIRRSITRRTKKQRG